MYLQITIRCNMRCAHCCFSCTSKGEDMSLDVVRAALNNYDGENYLTIGGGEPTLHPQFREILYTCLAVENTYVWLATNGSNEKISLELLTLATKFDPSYFGVALSIDSFHNSNKVSPVVLNTFKKYSKTKDNISLRDVTDKVTKNGRAIKNNLWENTWCACEDILIKPNGDIKFCGCKDSLLLGNVLTAPIDYDTYYAITNKYGACIKEIPQKERESILKIA